MRVPLALGEIELAALEGVARAGVRERLLISGVAMRRELPQEFGAAFAHRGRELGLVIREKKKRRRRGELLALEEHRRAGREQEQGGERAVAARGSSS